MAADIRKARENYPYKEGAAVSFNGVLANPLADVEISSVHRNPDEDYNWDEYASILDEKFRNESYYFGGSQANVASSGNTVSGADNTASRITYSSENDASHLIQGIIWSYNANPASGYLRIEDGSGTIIHNQYITTGGPGFVNFGNGLKGSENKNMIITLGPGGSGVKGDITVLGHNIK